MTPPRPTVRHDEGFTLAELIIVVSILGLVGAVLSALTFQGIRFSAQTERSLTSASAAIVTASKIQHDLRYAEAMGPGAGPFCPGPTGADPVFWSARDADGRPTVTTYFVTAGTDALPRSLVRVSCAAIPGLATTLTTSVLPAATAPTPGATAEVTSAGGLPDPSVAPYPLLVDDEIVRVTARSGNTLTLERRVAPGHDAGASVRLMTTSVGQPLAQWPREPRLGRDLVADLEALGPDPGDPDDDPGRTLLLEDDRAFPLQVPFDIVVGEETMTVTERKWATDTDAPAGPLQTVTLLRVNRPNPEASLHAAGSVVHVVTRLSLPAADEEITVAHWNGLPVSTPYRLLVGTGDEPEAMTVTGQVIHGDGSATLDVRRGSDTPDHLANTPVRFDPEAELVCAEPVSCHADVLTEPVNPEDNAVHILGPGADLPAVQDAPYDVLVNDEIMTVIDRTVEGSTTVLRVVRLFRPATPYDTGAFLRYTHRTAEVFFPSGVGRGGEPAAAMLAVTRSLT